ncbi:uncharacterized protein LOC124337676 [Daphnia pulicaria]|uniref:uncharacterized protein LOC124337676 n=1 Tax=Daphnia pulicaria TaxID=35523 RepID=UPI001EECF1C1|nr:uncharacterized protein LOC124337676 [Daphnia pulicaria]
MADALSRSPVDRPSESDEIAEGPQSFSARISLLDTMEGSDDANPDILLTSVAAATSADPIMLSLRQTILDGFPNEKYQFSGWPQVFPFPDTNTSTRRVIDALRSFFTCGAGAPVKLWSDGGPQFKSDEFLAFLRDWDISNGRSSPHHPQSNGYAESAVKSMKKLIAGSWSSGSFDPDTFGKALLLFRNAPMSGGASPSQIVFSRPTRDLLPAHRRSFAPEWQQAAELLEKRAQRAKELQIQHFNRTAHPLPPLVIGDSVLIQDHKSKRWSTPRVIVEVGPFRDYLVKTPAGRLFRRNRRFLRVISPQIPRPQPPASTSTTTSPVQLPGLAPPTAPSSTLRRSRRLAAKIAL